ncbi:hypothetical protein ACQPZF_32075 [Actinosynnema sp. CS-041913]|uniref:hypothetical protein n=1 Tax=Actinosynnema sp. CS-041913 TaxID=3239917 RepID=UPI003D8FC584
MTAQPPSDLFSHPDTDLQTESGPRDDRQRAYTDLFREPADDPPQADRRTA